MAVMDRSETGTAWCAYFSDGSDFALFTTEVAALRHAVDHGMSVKEVPFGVWLREFVLNGPPQ